ncbi:hypothetical protein MRX96_031488 [Rhipicephalus microplus]
MRYSGPSKRRREAVSGRVPPMWTGRPMAGGPAVATQAVKKGKANIVQFEWNGCTFYRYIPEGTKGPTSRHMIPGEPPIPLPPFARPPFEWRQRTSRSQSRRRKQPQVFPPRAPAPLWTPRPLPLNRSGGGPESTKQFAAVAVAMGTSGGGSVPYRPREPNPRIPRKESKTPASHMHLPPFLAAVSSKPPTKSPSPNTATRVQGPPRAAAFKTKDFASTVPLPFPLRAAFAANECCASPALPKRNEAPGTNSGTGQGSSGGGGKSKPGGGGNTTARRSNDGGGVRESDMLGAKPKKPPRMNNMTFTKSSERSSGNSSYNSGNKAFSRAPPFRNSPRVYSSTILKDFNSPSKQDNGRGTATDYKPMLSVPREAPPKEQRSARKERRVKYKAEIVGTNIIVTQEEPSPEKPDTTATTTSVKEPKTSSQASGGAGDKKAVRGMSSKVPAYTPNVEHTGWKDRDESAFQSRILHAALLHGTSVASEGRSSVTADAFTQLTTFEVNEQFDRFLAPGPTCVKQENAALASNLKPPSGIKWCGKFRSVPAQTDEMQARACEHKDKHLKEHGAKITETKRQEEDEKSEQKPDVEDEKEVRAVEHVLEPLSESEEMISPASYAETLTSSSDIHLGSLVSDGVSTPSPREDSFHKPGGDKNLTPENSAALLNQLDNFLKECSPILGAQQSTEKAQVVPKSRGSSTPISEDASKNSCPASTRPDTSSSLSKGDGFSDISEPHSPLAKDLQVHDGTSIASDMILINFAEDTTTLKEHLDGLVADYKAKHENDPPDDTGMAFSPNGGGCRPRSTSSGAVNVLEKHPGSSPTRSSAPVLLPSDVSTQDMLKMTPDEACTAGGDFRSSLAAKGPLQVRKDCIGDALSDRGDSSVKITHGSGTGTTENRCRRSVASCDSCGAVYCGSNSDNFPRVCSCKTRHGARAKGSKPLIAVEIDEALKEEYRDREIVPCFVEENIEYLLESGDEEYGKAAKQRSGHQTSYHERSGPGSEEHSAAASRRYPENSSSWNRIKDACDASTTAVAGTELCGGDTTGAASRAFIYDCPWWTYDQGGNEAASKDTCSSTALPSSDQVSADTPVAAAVSEIASDATAATLHPWSTTLRAAAAAAETGVHGVTAAGPGAVTELPGSEATAGGNPWGPFLATAQAIVGPKMEVVMSSGDHETGDSCRAARSDADFTTLYMEGQPRKPVLKQRWPTETGAAGGTSRPSAAADWRGQGLTVLLRVPA